MLTDACVTTSLGPRWAIVGPFMANAMGGGGGSDGFRHLLEHLGPATETLTSLPQASTMNFPARMCPLWSNSATNS
jgi:hypothetical protein